MMLKYFATTLLCTSIGLSVCYAQEIKPEPSIERPNRPTDPRLKFLTLRLRIVVGDDERENVRVSDGRFVKVEVLATNRGPAVLPLKTRDSLVNYIPKLYNGGVLIPYLDAMNERIHNRSDPDRDSLHAVRVPRNQEVQLAIIELKKYYDKLAPGVYKLSLKYWDWDGEIESDAIVFEVADAAISNR